MENRNNMNSLKMIETNNTAWLIEVIILNYHIQLVNCASKIMKKLKNGRIFLRSLESGHLEFPQSDAEICNSNEKLDNSGVIYKK